MNPSAENSFSKSNEEIASSSRERSTVLPTSEKYQVRHGIFKWSIENFSAFPSVNDKYCLSPIFELKDTWWHVVLHPKAKIWGQDKISLNLIREKSDIGPQKVLVSYRLGLENNGNKLWFRPEKDVIFGKGDCFGFQTSVLGHLEDFLIEDNNDTLSVLCEIYIVYILNVNIISSSQNLLIDPDLSSDLISLFKTERRYDVLIETPKSRVRAHKSVLSARSKTLARMFEDGKSFIQLSCTTSCLYCVLQYMYSGSFIFLTRNSKFHIGLYELACELSLFNLRNLLTPSRRELKSRIIVDECEILCKLNNVFINNTFSEKIESRDYFEKETGIGIKICLQQENSSDFLEFLVNISGIVTALDFSFQLYILNKNCESLEMIPAQPLQNSEAVFKNLIFTYTLCLPVSDVMKCCSSDDNLCLKFSCKRHSLTHLSDVSLDVNKDLSVPCDDYIDDYNYWLEDLSLHLKKLLMTGFLSDFTLVASGHPFKVHRTILAARSTYFQTLFLHDQHKNDVLNVPGVECHILMLMLTHVYSGTLNESCITKSDILELYKVAEEYEIKSLRSKCVDLIALYFDPWFVFEVLTAAERYNNSDIIRICMDYINKCESHMSETEDLSDESDEL